MYDETHGDYPINITLKIFNFVKDRHNKTRSIVNLPQSCF